MIVKKDLIRGYSFFPSFSPVGLDFKRSVKESSPSIPSDSIIETVPDPVGGVLNKELFMSGWFNLILEGRLADYDMNYLKSYISNNISKRGGG